MITKTKWLTLLFLGSVSSAAFAQKAVSQGDIVEVTARITAIDHDDRLVTLEDEEGNVETIYAGPSVKRFDELEVGDEVTFRLYESLVSQIRKTGEAAPSKAGGMPTLVRGTGPKPSGTLSQQLSATVTIKSIDASVPSVTVTLEDGHTMSSKVEDKKLLERLQVGDKVDITYTAALMIAVK
jgi:hypothetical protein